jgi:O-acetyl-ADP-ribose deacetylase (regulator of RNase III)
VIHTVGPVWRGGRSGEAELLASCYRSALDLARQHGLRSIAFPAISCGVFAYPIRLAGSIAVAAVAERLAGDDHFQQVVLVAFEAEVHDALTSVLRDRQASSNPPPDVLR